MRRLLRKLTGFNDRRILKGLRRKSHSLAERLSVAESTVLMLLIIEDKRFMSHIGVDLMALLRASIYTVFRIGMIQGGSTITQQLYYIYYQENRRERRRITAKIRQIFWSIWHEINNEKADILRAYLAKSYYGGNCFGINSISRVGFGVKPEALDCEQSFFISERLACPNLTSNSRIRNILDRAACRLLIQEGRLDVVKLAEIYSQKIAEKKLRVVSAKEKSDVVIVCEAGPITFS